ncbi:MAG TPA: hypothetical protein VLG72_02410 [Nitrospirota bacterium]|nr:hypothetical protein [Nitrospirota bacterium]
MNRRYALSVQYPPAMMSCQRRGGELRSLQEKMMSDKEILSLIQSLQYDPKFERILQDPEVMEAVNSGDIAALMANARFMKLLNNSTLRV